LLKILRYFCNTETTQGDAGYLIHCETDKGKIMPVVLDTMGDQKKSGLLRQRALFTLYPELKSVVASTESASLPTPVQPLPFSVRAWIKRDDLTHTEYGGNKIRKLEFIVADAKRKGAKRIVTFGAIGTNHGVATAMMCQQFDLECVVYLFDQPSSETVTQNLKRMQAYGATLIYTGSLFITVMAYYTSIYRAKKGSYFLFAGGSNLYGTLSFLNAAIELREQIDRGECPQPETIVCPVGSGATLAGLTYGCHLSGLDTRVLGIRVVPQKLGPFAACTQGTVYQLMEEVHQFLKQHVRQPVAKPMQPWLVGDYYGEGYGVGTSKGAQAINTFRAVGIKLEQTYTAKAAAAFIDELDRRDSHVLFWNTFNSRDMSAKASAAQVPHLPKVLHKLLQPVA
jgi:1-aminocyclopropane-1-carboxylate deaminase/D-cysteine desulfhydrase-like pyridoxal-dependent ACC family enzyme